MRPVNNWKVRAASLLLVLASCWYVPWVLLNLNWGAWWLALPFAGATLLTATMTLVTAINNWNYALPKDAPLSPGAEPEVLVILPTYGEPPSMVTDTGRSVLAQDYPQQKICLVISDDSHREGIRFVAKCLQEDYPRATVVYHEPPRRGNPARRGTAKAGNLNSALDWAAEHAPHIQFIETRDADDCVGDPSFLRQVVGQLVAHPRTAFVQTIKEAVVAPGDPFSNLEPLFYRRALLARNAGNAVFPCGSGLVWRGEALADIGGFPTWNLVEDLQSGIEALGRGWRGIYLPIVGAYGQTAPEDVPNVTKQRGTWAVDTLRLTFWGHKRGLNLWQHIHFAELALFYMLSFAVLLFALLPVITLTFEIYPVLTTQAEYSLHFWLYALGIELFLVTLAEGLPYETLWRARQIWLGFAPVYAKAFLIALLWGPNRKPLYRVTRKQNLYGWYWREVWFQTVLLVALVAASVYHVATHSLLSNADLGSLFWAGFFVVALLQIVRNSWHGYDPLAAIGHFITNRPRSVPEGVTD